RNADALQQLVHQALSSRMGASTLPQFARVPWMKTWFLYLLECRGGSYYAGITNDLEARYQAHLEGRGAKYTRANPPLRLIASAAFPDRSAASRAEWEIKRLPRARKLAYLQSLAEPETTVEA